MLQLVCSECLGEDINYFSFGSNIPEFQFTIQDPLDHKVIVHSSECLGEDIGYVSVGSNIPELHFTAQVPPKHKVIVHFYVLHASMEKGVLCQLHTIDVVTVH